jgi:toxin FitB
VILVDSNVVIYSRQLEYQPLRELLAEQAIAANWIVATEVLGWQHLKDYDEEVFRDFFDQIVMIELDRLIFEQTILLRRQHRIDIADSLIAATAFVHKLELWTHNTSDFEDIEGLKLFDPIKES